MDLITSLSGTLPSFPSSIAVFVDFFESENIFILTELTPRNNITTKRAPNLTSIQRYRFYYFIKKDQLDHPNYVKIV